MMGLSIEQRPEDTSFEISSSAWPALHERFKANGLLLISQVPNNDDNLSLLSLAQHFGSLVPGGLANNSLRLESDFVYRVESATDRREVDFEGESITSQTSDCFNCHTDGYRSNLPPNVVLLMCVRGSHLGGETLVAPVDDILARLAPEELKLLRGPFYPSKAGFGPIVYGDPERPSVRFNYIDIDRYCLRKRSNLPIGIRAVLDKFASFTGETKVRFRFRLTSGECLILDNRRVLHGRTEFEIHSNRLIKRVWVSCDPAGSITFEKNKEAG